MAGGKFTVTCPCCETRLTIDRGTGAVIGQERAKRAPARSFEQALSEEKKRREGAQDRFAQAVREHEHREEILEKKFEEARKKAASDSEPLPPRPFDLD